MQNRTSAVLLSTSFTGHSQSLEVTWFE